MVRGLYAAASGMIATEARQEVIANNIANASTAGYKAHAPVQLGFYEIFSNSLQRPFIYDQEAAPGGGAKIVETYTNTREGVFQTTENPLNVALQGPGYLVVQTPRGERYTRAGDFTVDTEGSLVTPDGYKVLSMAGAPIDVRNGVVSIDDQGQVKVDGVPAGQLQMIEFEDPTRLTREGDSLYSASKEVAEKSGAAENTRLVQNTLEMSNVDLPLEMTRMMLGLRAYEANQKVIQGVDSTISKLIEQVGMP